MMTYLNVTQPGDGLPLSANPPGNFQGFDCITLNLSLITNNSFFSFKTNPATPKKLKINKYKQIYTVNKKFNIQV